MLIRSDLDTYAKTYTSALYMQSTSCQFTHQNLSKLFDQVQNEMRFVFHPSPSLYPYGLFRRSNCMNSHQQVCWQLRWQMRRREASQWNIMGKRRISITSTTHKLFPIYSTYLRILAYPHVRSDIEDQAVSNLTLGPESVLPLLAEVCCKSNIGSPS